MNFKVVFILAFLTVHTGSEEVPDAKAEELTGAKAEELTGAKAEEVTDAMAQEVTDAKAQEVTDAKAASSTGTDEEDGDIDAPFMIVLRHIDGWRCAGALVSIRTGVTSRWCLRGRGNLPAKEVWALPVSSTDDGAHHQATAARRVTRVYLPTGIEDLNQVEGDGWHGAIRDLAVFQMERAFISAVKSRPILMATEPGDCVANTCYVVRTSAGSGHIESVNIVDANECSRAAHHWPLVKDLAVCLTGPRLCSKTVSRALQTLLLAGPVAKAGQVTLASTLSDSRTKGFIPPHLKQLPSDWGSSLVCAGKLCGMVSRSAPGPAANASTPTHSQPDDNCGDVHVAQSIALWKPFLHCSHSLNMCGKGECAQICTEHRLTLEDDSREDTGRGTQSVTNNAPTQSRALSLADSNESGSEEDTAPVIESQKRVVNSEKEETSLEPKVEKPGIVSKQLDSLLNPDQKATQEASVHRERKKTLPLRLASKQVSTKSARKMMVEHQATPPPFPAGPQRPAFEFEPNRADFKAGEYGDNVAMYANAEEPAMVTTPGPGTSNESLSSPTHSPPTKTKKNTNAPLEQQIAPKNASLLGMTYKDKKENFLREGKVDGNASSSVKMVILILILEFILITFLA